MDECADCSGWEGECQEGWGKIFFGLFEGLLLASFALLGVLGG